MNVRKKFFVALFLLPLFLVHPSSVAQSAAASPQDAAIQADVAKALDNKRFKDVSIAVQERRSHFTRNG